MPKTCMQAFARPDLVIGLGIAALNGDAAREVWTAARKEARLPRAGEQR